jgi:hypothetical protein
VAAAAHATCSTGTLGSPPALSATSPAAPVQEEVPLSVFPASAAGTESFLVLPVSVVHIFTRSTAAHALPATSPAMPVLAPAAPNALLVHLLTSVLFQAPPAPASTPTTKMGFLSVHPANTAALPAPTPTNATPATPASNATSEARLPTASATIGSMIQELSPVNPVILLVYAALAVLPSPAVRATIWPSGGCRGVLVSALRGTTRPLPWWKCAHSATIGVRLAAGPRQVAATATVHSTGCSPAVAVLVSPSISKTALDCARPATPLARPAATPRPVSPAFPRKPRSRTPQGSAPAPPTTTSLAAPVWPAATGASLARAQPPPAAAAHPPR